MNTTGCLAQACRLITATLLRRIAALALAQAIMTQSALAESAAGNRVQDWQHLLDESGKLHADQQVEYVNRFFNAYRQVSDRRAWNREDHWSTPAELMRTGRGDCEDLAIAKYFTLLELGIPADRLRLLVSKRFNPGNARIEGHMVLLYRDTRGRELVLDNTETAIRPLRERADLLPRLAFNHTMLWDLRDTERRLDNTISPRRWQQVLARVASDPG